MKKIIKNTQCLYCTLCYIIIAINKCSCCISQQSESNFSNTADNAVRVLMLGNQQGGPTANWSTGSVCPQRILGIRWHDFIRNVNVHYTVRPITHHSHPLSSLVVFLSLGILSEWIRMQTPVKSFWASSQELETSTWVAKYYLDKDHPRWSLFRGSGATWSQRTGSESTSLETDVFV